MGDAHVVGCINVSVSYESQTVQMPLLIVKEVGPSRNWMRKNWAGIHMVQDQLQEVLDKIQKYKNIIQKRLATLQEFKGRKITEPDAQPWVL